MLVNNADVTMHMESCTLERNKARSGGEKPALYGISHHILRVKHLVLLMKG